MDSKYYRNIYMKLLVKLSNGKTIQINSIKNNDTIEVLKMHTAYNSNIPMHQFELYWNDTLLSPDSLLLEEIEVKGEKLPLHQYNVNNVIIMRLH